MEVAFGEGKRGVAECAQSRAKTAVYVGDGAEDDGKRGEQDHHKRQTAGFERGEHRRCGGVGASPGLADDRRGQTAHLLGQFVGPEEHAVCLLKGAKLARTQVEHCAGAATESDQSVRQVGGL